MFLEVSPEVTISAKEAGLRYVSDSRSGIVRRRVKNGSFRYFGATGRPVRDREQLKRIRRPFPRLGRTFGFVRTPRDTSRQLDARGRKQYRYHADWRSVRDQNKYDRVIAFGRALPKIRRRVARDLARCGLPREKVLATIVRLLELSLIRIGNDEYARDNKSYGLTRFQDRHAVIRAGTITFKFRGKSGRKHVLDVRSRVLAGIVKRCRDLPGYELFQYLDGSGAPIDVTSSDVNAYLREISGSDFSAKDFRTWAGTVLAARALQEFEKFASPSEARRNILLAIEAVARMLGNTPAICRRCYVHPVVLDSYLEGTLVDQLRRRAERTLVAKRKTLTPEEAAVLVLLQQTLTRQSRRTH